MELRFDTILFSKSGNENSDAGRVKCLRGPHLARRAQIPHICPKWWGPLAVAQSAPPNPLLPTCLVVAYTSRRSTYFV